MKTVGVILTALSSVVAALGGVWCLTGHSAVERAIGVVLLIQCALTVKLMWEIATGRRRWRGTGGK
jgi:hypothetical protein